MAISNMDKFQRLSNLMEDDGIRLQMEAEEKRELSEEEWKAEVLEWLDDLEVRMQASSQTLEEAYKDMME